MAEWNSFSLYEAVICCGFCLLACLLACLIVNGFEVEAVILNLWKRGCRLCMVILVSRSRNVNRVGL